MFTGIVEETGRIVQFSQGPGSWLLRIAASRTCEGVAQGDSIAVDGCRRTGVGTEEGCLDFDVLEEPRRLTHFSELRPGSAVNLERSLRFDGKVGGHFVTGHIDGIGRIEVLEPRGNDTYLRIKAPPGDGKYLIHKGSIAIDGISLTVAEVEATVRRLLAGYKVPRRISFVELLPRLPNGKIDYEAAAHHASVQTL